MVRAASTQAGASRSASRRRKQAWRREVELFDRVEKQRRGEKRQRRARDSEERRLDRHAELRGRPPRFRLADEAADEAPPWPGDDESEEGGEHELERLLRVHLGRKAAQPGEKRARQQAAEKRRRREDRFPQRGREDARRLLEDLFGENGAAPIGDACGELARLDLKRIGGGEKADRRVSRRRHLLTQTRAVRASRGCPASRSFRRPSARAARRAGSNHRPWARCSR